jgi:hypothetical protein
VLRDWYPNGANWNSAVNGVGQHEFIVRLIVSRLNGRGLTANDLTSPNKARKTTKQRKREEKQARVAAQMRGWRI